MEVALWLLRRGVGAVYDCQWVMEGSKTGHGCTVL